MHDGEVERFEYTGEIWESQDLHPDLAHLLTGRDTLIVLRNEPAPYRVVLGVPHHAAVGRVSICDRRLDESGNVHPRRADENAASYALVAYRHLAEAGIPCKLVIMAHATTHDPNKVLDSPYCREIFAGPPYLLLECHGSNLSRNLALELSAGRNHLAAPLRFGRALWAASGRRYSLGVQSENGHGSALILHPGGAEVTGVLELSARKTDSLIEAARRNIPALHLEAKPRFRKPRRGGSAISQDGRILGQAIAQAITEYFA